MRANTTQNPLIQLIEDCYNNFRFVFPIYYGALDLQIPNQITSLDTIDPCVQNTINANFLLNKIRENFYKHVKTNYTKINDTIAKNGLKEAVQLGTKAAYEKYKLNTHKHIYRARICLFMLMKITSLQAVYNKILITRIEEKTLINSLIYLNQAYNACPDIYKTVDYKNAGFFESILQPFFDVIRQWPCCKDDATPLSEEEVNNDFPYPEQKMSTL